MIAAIFGRAGDRQFVPLTYDSRADRWTPLIGDRGRVGMTSRETAALVCALELAANLERMTTAARQLHILTEHARATPTNKRHMRELAADLLHSLESAEIDARRLIDTPTASDAVDIDAHAETREQWTADEALFHFIADCLVRVRAFTDNEYTDRGIDEAIERLRQLRDIRPQPANTNASTGSEVKLTLHQLRAGRELAGLRVRELASASGVAFNTIKTIELGVTRAPRKSTMDKLRGILSRAGVEFGAHGWLRHIDDGERQARRAAPTDE